MPNFVEFRPVEADFFSPREKTDARTDGREEANSLFLYHE